MSEQSAAFQALVELAQASRQAAKGLPAQLDAKRQWSGVGFSLLGARLVAPMGEITEMLEVPSYTRLPGVKPWIKGVANVRGRLLPLFDLAVFFGGHLAAERKQQRVLVLESNGLYSGLIVDRVFGMQHFAEDGFVAAGPELDNFELDPVLAPFISGSYEGSQSRWALFDPQKLASDRRFVDASQD